MERVRILFLASNPMAMPRVSFADEAREIDIKIRAAEHRESFELITQLAIRPDDLLDAFNRHRPHVVHFSSQGNDGDELILVGDDGQPRPVAKPALARLFRVLGEGVRVVVLNACYSQPQAQVIAEHVDCVVGMRRAIDSRAGIRFVAAFYRALAFGRSVANAFEQGVASLDLEGTGASDVPDLVVRRSGVVPASIVLVSGADVHHERLGSGPRIQQVAHPYGATAAPNHKLSQLSPAFVEGLQRVQAGKLGFCEEALLALYLRAPEHVSASARIVPLAQKQPEARQEIARRIESVLSTALTMQSMPSRWDDLSPLMARVVMDPHFDPALPGTLMESLYQQELSLTRRILDLGNQRPHRAHLRRAATSAGWSIAVTSGPRAGASKLLGVGVPLGIGRIREGQPPARDGLWIDDSSISRWTGTIDKAPLSLCMDDRSLIVELRKGHLYWEQELWDAPPPATSTIEAGTMSTMVAPCAVTAELNHTPIRFRFGATTFALLPPG